MSRKLILVAVLAVAVAVAAIIFVFVTRQPGSQPTAITPVAEVPENCRAPVAGHGPSPSVPPVAAKSATIAAPAAPKSDDAVAAMPSKTELDLKKIVAGLTREQAAKLQQASFRHETAKQDEARKYNLPIENSLRWMDLAFNRRDLALSDDQLAKLDAIKQKINTQMEVAGIIDLVNQQYALRGQANDILKGLNQPDLTPDQRQQIKDRARVPDDQASQIARQVSQAKVSFNQEFIDNAKTILTPAQNQALDKLLDKPTGPG